MEDPGDRNLSIEDQYFRGRYKYIYKVLRHASTHQESKYPVRILEHLQTAVINPADFRMVHVTTLCRYVPQIIIENWIYLPGTIEPLMFSTQNLQVLLDFPFHTQDFKQFISYFPSLEELNYQLDRRSLSRELRPRRYISMNSLINSLIKAKDTLKKLVIVPPDSCHYVRMNDTHIESLVNFEHLMFLDVVAFDQWVWLEEPSISTPAPAFDNSGSPTLHRRIIPLVDIVPKSLVYLTLREGTKNTLLHIQGLLETRRQRLQKLDFIRVVLSDTVDWFDVQEDVAKLTKLGLECGVNLEVDVDF